MNQNQTFSLESRLFLDENFKKNKQTHNLAAGGQVGAAIIGGLFGPSSRWLMLSVSQLAAGLRCAIPAFVRSDILFFPAYPSGSDG